MRIILFVVIALFSITTFSQDKNSVAPPARTIATVDVASKNEELAVLRAQVQIMQDYKDDLLTTVYWSLGGIFAIAILLAGWSWFGAFRIQQAEVKRIHGELSNDIESWKAQVEKYIAATRESQKSEIALAVKEVTRSEVDNLAIKIKKNRSHAIDLGRRFELLSAISDVRYWGYKAVPANIFTSHMRVLSAAKLLGDSWEIDNSLEKMTAIARANRKALDASDISTLLPILDSLPPEHEISVSQLKDALRSVPL